MCLFVVRLSCPCKLYKGRNFVSFTILQDLEQCLTHTRFSMKNALNEWMSGFSVLGGHQHLSVPS